MLIIDTCSWLKVRYLEESQILKIKDLLYESDLWATHELINEYRYYLDDFLDIRRFSIESVKIEKMVQFIDKELDEADLSIIEFGRKNNNASIISDDGAELALLNLFQLKSFQLSDFLVFLCKEDILEKRETLKSIEQLRKWRDIKEKKKKRLITQVNLIR